MSAAVAILMGSDSDLPVVEPALEELEALGLACEAHVLSAHRSPAALHEFVAAAPGRGVQVFIAAAGGAAHLAGVVASLTTRPVIGVPVDSSPLGGVDALHATVQMPAGIPVATMAVGRAGARNAAILAAQILALADPALAGRLQQRKREMAEGVAATDARLQGRLAARGR